MNFFISPKQIAELIFKRKNYVFNDECKTLEWFYSEAGAQAFADTKTLAEKTLFFYEYLKSFDNKSEDQEEKKSIFKMFKSDEEQVKNDDYKMAFFMAETLVEGLLHTDSYLDLLDVKKNLYLSDYLGKRVFSTTRFLAILKSQPDGSVFENPKNNPYEKISYCKKDSLTEAYKIERLIIAIGQTDGEKFAPPFLHNFNGMGVR